MSYARFGQDGSDVYVFLSRDGLECCGCPLQKVEWVEDPDAFLGGYLNSIGEIIQTTFTNTEGMVEHLLEHTRKGHYVPPTTLVDLIMDDEENFKEKK